MSDELDLAIAAGERAGDTENPALAYAYQCRWDLAGDPADRDRAIELWHRALAVTADPAGLNECARLLGERGQANADAADTDASIELFELAAAGGEPQWWYLAMAYWLRWQLGRQPADLERAARNMDLGLARPESPAWLVAAHLDRLAVARDLLDAESRADPTRAPRSAATLLQQIDAARAVWSTGAGDPDDRARLAVGMAATATVAWQSRPDTVDPDWLSEMVACGRTLADPPPDWSRQLDTLEALARYARQARTGGRLPDDALDVLLEPMRDEDADPGVRHSLRQVATMFMAARGIQSGDRRTLRTAVDQFRASDDPEDRLIGEAFALTDRAQHGDLAARDDLAVLLDRLRTEPLSYVTRQSIAPLLAMIESVLSGVDGRYRPVDRTPIAAGDVAAADLALRALFGPVTAATTRHDVATLRECADRADELLAVFPPGHLLSLIGHGLAVMAGSALLVDEPGDQDAAGRLLRWTETGIAVTEGPQHPRWASFALARGEALRQIDGGDRAGSRRWGLAGLEGYSWQVLLQSGTDDALQMAAAAGAAARRVAGWAQADGAVDDMIAALDAGRGLVLYAATASRTIAQRLTEAGHPDLAEQWLASAGYGRDAVTGDPLRAAGGDGFEVPDDLRTRVLRALDLRAPAPASVDDIRAGLVAAGADALVYLVPSSDEQPGAAVVVPAAGEPELLVLPGLITVGGSTFARGAAAVRDAGPVHRPAGTPGSGPDDLCRWAWSAAMGPLLARPGRRRLILVPIGPLSSVPWHAAFHTDGDRRHYAVEQAVISYAVSGRAFVESAREPARPVREVLIVGDPTGDLPFAGIEARAIGAAFYPEAKFLGHTAHSGTPEQVLDWIAAAAPGPSLLHLACHGRADPVRPADAGLRLAGGELAARQLLDASRTAELEIERVFLAACATGLPGETYDEAFSLTTAFLAAGARTAFGSLWPVPDQETSVLMFLVHHYLNADGCAPADALHRAQLWMLDPDRVPPPGLPPELTPSGIADPRSWAAFTHHGR